MTPDTPEQQERCDNGWLIRFTDDELNAIYTAIENVPSGDEDAFERVIEKITPAGINKPPAGVEPAPPTPRRQRPNE